ncbi:MAG TPA: hypothetical protein VLW52_00665 [Opitutaceae bacterium]|nr:hypothetical protein [Opitutaceae bacterium]
MGAAKIQLQLQPKAPRPAPPVRVGPSPLRRPAAGGGAAGAGGGQGQIGNRPAQLCHRFDRLPVTPPPPPAVGRGEGGDDVPGDTETGALQSVAATDPTAVRFSTGRQIVHTPACGGQTIQAIADPHGVTVTWTLRAGTATLDAGTSIDAAGNITLGAAQAGGTIVARATSGSGGWAEAELQLHSHPTGIASTSVAGPPPDAAHNYGAKFDHVFNSSDGNVASLENVAVGERFPNVPNPDAASHTVTGTPFGNGTFQLATATLTPDASNNWFLTSAGGLGGTLDQVTIGHDGIDIGQHIPSTSNPTPANPLPAAFSVQQDLNWFCPAAAANARWNNFISIQHERRLRLGSTGPEVVVSVNNQPQVDAYVGPTGVRNARATPATVVRSSGRTPNTVQIAADALPAGRALHFSIPSANRLGCSINASTGVLTVGQTAGQIVVRVANRNGGSNFDEVTVTITDPPAATGTNPPPTATPAPQSAVPGSGTPETTTLESSPSSGGSGSHGTTRFGHDFSRTRVYRGDGLRRGFGRGDGAAVDARPPVVLAPPGTPGSLAPKPVLIGATPVKLPEQSQGELVLQSFLNRMWAAQSDSQRPFRITAGVREGLDMIFPNGAPTGAITIYPTAADLFNQLRPKVPANISPLALPVLDRLPDKEKPLPEGPAKPTGDPANPKFPTESPVAKDPEKAKGEKEAMQAALQASFEEFRKTKLGQELETAAKAYVFSKEGIPLVAFVVTGALTFVAANDPKLPSVPEIPLGEGIKLKIDYSGKASDLPPLLRQLVTGHSGKPAGPGTEETKIGVSVTITFEAAAELAAAVGRFFSKAASWIAKGVVTVGTIIGKAASSIARELLAMAGGALAGALIGGAVGGLAGAGIGALIGAGAGLIGSLISRLF